MPYIVYSLQSDCGSYDTGQTNNLERRLKQHRAGKVQSTKRKAGWELIHEEHFDLRIDAIHREREIKQKSRAYIERLVKASRDRVETLMH